MPESASIVDAVWLCCVKKPSDSTAKISWVFAVMFAVAVDFRSGGSSVEALARTFDDGVLTARSSVSPNRVTTCLNGR